MTGGDSLFFAVFSLSSACVLLTWALTPLRHFSIVFGAFHKTHTPRLAHPRNLRYMPLNRCAYRRLAVSLSALPLSASVTLPDSSRRALATQRACTTVPR
jgi:hypothetical protein